MTSLELLLPRANAPIAGNLAASREFYDFLRALIALAGEQSSDSESIEALEARVSALEASGQITASVSGLGSVQVTGSLEGGAIIIQLDNDEDSPAGWSYYGTGPDGVKGFVPFSENIQQLSEISGDGFALLSSGTWGLRLFAGANGVTINDDGTTVTINGNPFFAASDFGDSPLGPAAVTAEQSVAIGAGASGGHFNSVAAGPGTATTDENQFNIGARSFEINGHTIEASGSDLLFDGSPIGGAGAAPCTTSATFNGGSGSIAVGVFCDLSVPFDFDITQATLVGDPSGSLEIDVLNVPLGSYPPTSGDSICGGNLPELVGTSNYQDSTLTGWSVSIAADSVLRFIVTASSGVTSANLVLFGSRT